MVKRKIFINCPEVMAEIKLYFTKNPRKLARKKQTPVQSPWIKHPRKITNQ